MNKKEIDIDYRCYANSLLPRYYIVSRIEYDFESGGWYSQVDVAKLEKNKQAIKYGTLADAKKHAESIYMQHKDKYGADMRIVIIDELIDVDSLNKNINKLERQLEEKDKEIDRLIAQLIEKNNINKRLDYENQKLYEDLWCEPNNKRLAIEELEKLKSYLRSEIEDAKVLLDPIEYEDYHEMLGVVRGYKLSLEVVDKRIKELKGE